MVNWQITATTTICDKTGKEVTLMVYRDGGLKCTGESKDLPLKARLEKCSAFRCDQVESYREKLMSEETANG